ncbi:probable cytosolic oligopeptidase A [Olea europaea subsp. europaea]|uniref:Probable cytosolic oligopeptidase A n=1 Tax=Olea europaea subsp. europaea TaxID=158383 RepID=A0A8S0TVW2_OLEEU|nr:probable cytosolic oligopeptidase A [Olea europaea subsp. europaea]
MEELRLYSSLQNVIDGLLKLTRKLFNIDIEPADGEAPVWSKDVCFYKIKDCSGSTIAYFYFDPYSCPSEKRGGAWMDVVVGRTCVMTPPTQDKPSLMTIREVEAVFHEFGHALQHML